MGSIWIAYDPQLKRRVALKLARPDWTFSGEARMRFEREAMAVAQIRNPHVVQVYDFGFDEGSPYIVMELLDGEDLSARLHRCPKLPLDAVIAVVTQAARGLSTAHTAGIIHRDLKPANIFFAQGDADEVVKILDFGAAAVGAGSLPGAVFRSSREGPRGSPAYMSPEQTGSADCIDHRSDLWSLSVVAYRALTGRDPFTGTSPTDVVASVWRDAPVSATQLAPELPAEVDRFFERALAKDPSGRFASARDLSTAFARLADAGRRSKPKQILVVDDEPDIAILLKQRFRQKIRSATYEFFFAEDGEAGLEELRRHSSIDIALTDINMPRMDGLTFLERIGEINPLVKVVMMSAYGDMDNIRQAMNRGAFDFLLKPLNLEDLEITLEKTLKHAHDLKETIRSNEENAVLRRFVNNGIIERLSPELRAEGSMATEQVRATVAFFGFHGLPAASDEVTPEALVRALNAHFDIVVLEVTARRGVVDKFIGEAVMAVFRGEDHATRALKACLAVRDKLASLDTLDELMSDPPLYARGVTIGAESGDLIAGSIGSKILARLDYTVLGVAVKSAARLQAVAARDQILIGPSLYEKARAEFECERIEPRAPPGEAGAPAVYAVLHPRGAEMPPPRG